MANHKNGEVSAMNDIKLALLGNKEAAKRLTDAGVMAPCAHFSSMIVVFRPKMEMLEGMK